jgi:hypothetical protein
VSDFIARIERGQGPPLDSVKVSLHESEFGAWRGYFFCAARERFTVGEIVRLALLGGRRRTAVVYGTEAVVGRQMWVVDLVGADPPRSAPPDPGTRVAAEE